jgi:phosphatidate cytidylyltransferase
VTLTSPQQGQGGGRVGADLTLRIVSSIALIPLAIGAAWLGGWWFFAFWLAAAIGVMWEWAGLVAGGRASARITVAGALALILAALAIAFGRPLAAVAVVATAAVAVAALANDRRVLAGAGVAYATAIVLPAIVLRADAANGFIAILLLFAVVWATDIAAYFGGRLIGGPKLWPQVSPKKTWSGASVGTAVAVAAGIGVGYGAGAGNLAALGVVCLLLSVASQAGDLFESALKRKFGAKDSSQLIPGHGGLMDRLDGFVVAALLAVSIGLWRGGFSHAATGLIIW